MRLDVEIPAAPALQRGDQPVDTGPFHGLVVLGQHGLGRTGEPSPQRRVYVPEQHPVPLHGVGEATAGQVQQPGHHREGVPAHQHPVVVEAEPAGHGVEKRADVPGGVGQRLLEVLRGHGVQCREHRAAGSHRRGVAQQPVQREGEPDALPPGQVVAHHLAGARPLRAQLGQGEVALGQFGAAGVDPVEDVDDDVDGLVPPGDLLLVEVPLEELVQAVQPLQVHLELVRLAGEPRDVRPEALGEQAGHVDPAVVVAHLGRRVELECLVLDVEAQPGERRRVAFEEGRRASPDHAVQRGDPLLAVQQQAPHTTTRGVPTHRLRVGLGLPEQQAADRITAVERPHETPDLVAVPHVSALELRQQNAAGVDLVENCR